MTPKSIQEFAYQNKLFSSGDKLIVALSGGLDSCVLLNVLHQLNLDLVIAHCNFGLRGKESDEDEKFCLEMSRSYGLPIEIKKFSEDDFDKSGASTQMIARQLRYDWFDELLEEHKAKAIAFGTHQDDSIETFFINLLRGSGPKGLSGIHPKRDQYIRPLLGTSRQEILSYATKNELQWREDSSNNSDKYLRNVIRNSVIPNLEKGREDAREGILRSLGFLKESQQFIERNVRQYDRHITKLGSQIVIDTKPLKEHSSEFLLREILADYLFNAHQSKQIRASLDSPGAMFYSDRYRLLVDRDSLVISTLSEQAPISIKINLDTTEIDSPIKIKASLHDIEHFEIKRDKVFAQFDLAELKFPLTLRRWKKGDRIAALGMNGSQLVSDILINEKVNRFEKEQTLVLVSADQVIWLVGHRISRQHCIKDSTKKIYLLQTLQS